MSMTEIEVPPAGTGRDLGSVAEDMIRRRIVHTLTIYPRLSNSMLQVGIGTGIPPRLWHPVLERMVAEGTVKRTIVKAVNPVTQREQVYTLLESEAVAA